MPRPMPEDQEDFARFPFPPISSAGETDPAMSALPQRRRMASQEPGGDSEAPGPPLQRAPPGRPVPVAPPLSKRPPPGGHSFARGPGCLAVQRLGTMRALDSAAQMEAGALAPPSPCGITILETAPALRTGRAYLGEAMAKALALRRDTLVNTPARSCLVVGA